MRPSLPGGQGEIEDGRARRARQLFPCVEKLGAGDRCGGDRLRVTAQDWELIARLMMATKTARTKTASKTTRKAPAKARATARTKAPATRKAAAKKAPATRKAAAARAKTATTRKATTRKAPAKKPAAPAKKPVAKKTVAKKPAPKKTVAAKKATQAKKSSLGKKAPVKKTPVKKAVAKKAAPRKAPAAKKAPAKKTVAAKKPAARKAAPAKATAAKSAPAPKKAPPKKVAAVKKPAPPKSPPPKKLGDFACGDFVVYPTHGVGRISTIEDQEVAGYQLRLFVVRFDKEKMTLRIPVGKAEEAGLRKLSTRQQIDVAIETLKGRSRVNRAMWSRRAQEYEAKINSGDPVAIAEVVRDLHRNAGQPDQSYSERQIYEAALERLSREVAAVDKIDWDSAVLKLEDILEAAA